MKSLPLWSLGFRPFFLGGALFACIALAGWGVWLYGGFGNWQPFAGGLAWHRHEMPFGFAGALIAGFLLTAVPNWTGGPGTHGWPLIGLFALWSLARIAWWLPLPGIWVIALQLPFLPMLAWLLGQQLLAAKKRNNYPIVAVLGLLAVCQGLTLWGIVEQDDGLQRRGVLAGIWLVAALMSVIGGRVIPFFIQRGLGSSLPFVALAHEDKVLLLGTLLVALLTACGLGESAHPWLAALYLPLAGLHGLRLWRWYDRGLWRVPLLWSLYLAYGWLLMATLGMAAWHLGWLVQQSLVSHGLAVGGIGGMILAMIARVSLGHTGRALQPPRALGWAFAALQLGALCRIVLVPFLDLGLGIAAALWSLSFALFLIHYTGMLLQPRIASRA
ncbi:NnrS family protein [Pseudomonas gingeri]|uniref:NnrS family protein n=1 Tax=Pseudomonas gingeri TaxID=117681 RepID=UPI0015A2CA36|nr:NnrS family protein [Pseudomonas gingeri]NWA05621.1 NnrS family protein [Pseudomonas gingeri]